MGSLLVPATDTAVAVEAAVLFPLLLGAAFAVRHDRDIRAFVFGIFTIALAFFGLRALH